MMVGCDSSCLTSIDWMESFGGARVFHGDFLGSDHRVLHVVLDFASVLDDSLGTRRFILEPLWRSNDAYRDVVMQSWSRGRINGDGRALLDSLESCAVALKVWGKSNFVSISKRTT